MLPVELIRIGSVAVIGIPGEITTMAGRRLRRIADPLAAAGIRYVAVGAYANEYTQYITTPEEYGTQHYEGAPRDPLRPADARGSHACCGETGAGDAEERPVRTRNDERSAPAARRRAVCLIAFVFVEASPTASGSPR
jgi:Neutral/alkaline non-lysosomal ceramidase, N-terminal